MLKDIVQQKERLFVSWPCLLQKKQVTKAQSACVDDKKQQKSQAERGNMESRSVRKEDFVKRQVDVKSFFVGPLATAICHDKSFGNRQVSWEEWKSWNEVFDLLEQKGEILSPGVLEKTRSLVWIGEKSPVFHPIDPQEVTPPQQPIE